jgi:ketosteroid isomerase-like protein
VSRASLDLVVRAHRALTQRPKPDFETVNALYHPDHVLRLLPQATQLGEAEVKGALGHKAFLEEQAEIMPFEQEFEGAVDIGRDLVLAVVAVRYRGAASGAELETRVWSLTTVAGGKITRTELFRDPLEALEAAARRES